MIMWTKIKIAAAAVGTAALAGVGVAVAADAQKSDFSIEPGHPRILFTARDIPALKNRIGSTHKSQWEGMKKWADYRKGSKWSNSDLNNLTPTYAFIYRLSGEQTYADEAISMARKLAALAVSSSDLENANRARALAWSYDWLYDRLTADDKAFIHKGITAHVQWLRVYPIKWGFGALDNHWAMDIAGVGYAGMAIYGDDPAAMGFISQAFSAYKQGIVTALRHFSGAGDGLWHEGMEYTRHELIPVFQFIEACRSALGQNLFAPEFQNFAYGTLYGTCPDKTLLREGDVKYPGVCTTWERKYMSMLASNTISVRWRTTA